MRSQLAPKRELFDHRRQQLAAHSLDMIQTEQRHLDQVADVLAFRDAQLVAPALQAHLGFVGDARFHLAGLFAAQQGPAEQGGIAFCVCLHGHVFSRCGSGNQLQAALALLEGALKGGALGGARLERVRLLVRFATVGGSASQFADFSVG
jgi:hypothetical protein